MNSIRADGMKTKSVNLRSIAFPSEHGGWSFILEPLILGLILAYSATGFMFALALLLGFLTHQPVKIVVKDRLKQRRTPRTQIALYFALGYGLLALVLAIPVLMNAPSILWWAILLITPFVMLQLFYDFNNKSRDIIPELSGAIALSGTVSLIVIVGNVSWQVALILWLLVSIRAVTSIVFVRTFFRKQRGKPADIYATYGLHLFAIALVVILAVLDVVPYFLIFPYVVLAFRAWRSIESPRVIKPQIIGIREIAYGILTVICIAMGFIFGI